jgi:hypothetical protein
LEETDIQELLDSHAAELPEKDFEHLTLLSEPDDDKHWLSWRPQLTTQALKKWPPDGS